MTFPRKLGVALGTILGFSAAIGIARRGQLLAIFYYRTPESRARRLSKIVEEAAALAEKKGDQRNQDQ